MGIRTALGTLAVTALLIMFVTDYHATGASALGPAAHPKRVVAQIDGVAFVKKRALLGKCSKVASAIGYAVPCPTVLPLGLRATPGVHGCQLGIVSTTCPRPRTAAARS